MIGLNFWQTKALSGREFVVAYRLYCEESLQLRSKRPRRRKMVIARRERYVAKRPNQAWSMDFLWSARHEQYLF
jgi:hypothetical protein